MTNLFLYPDTEEFQVSEKEIFSRVYLHGKLENCHESDLVRITEPIPKEDGIYECTFQGYSVTLYYWKDSENYQHGLVVDPDDQEACTYAFSCMKKRVKNL